MDLDTFIVAVFCAIDEELRELAAHERWRTRGPRPRLADSEVLTMEAVGEYLGIDTDRGLYAYFRRHDGAWFPALRRVHRTTFARQAANLWAVKERVWQRLVVGSRTRRTSRWSTASRCRSASSPAPTAAGGSAARRPTARTPSSARPSTGSASTSASAGPA